MTPKPYITSDSEAESVISILQLQPKTRRNSSTEKYKCKTCGKSFRRMVHLDRHEFKEHAGEKKHHCLYEGCNKSYSISTHLKRHLKTTHEKSTEITEKKIKCNLETCSQMFSTMQNMQRHFREVHENPKIYNCQYCGDVFTQRLKMLRHEITKHTKSYPFNCSKCSKGFYTEYHYKRHVNCKVYDCTICNLQFSKWSELLNHRKEKHDKQKLSYKCEHCPNVYKCTSDLKTHLLKIHLKENENMIYSCKEPNCGRSYAYEKNLRQHIKVAHKKIEFICNKEACKRQFKYKRSLQIHIQRDHDGEKVEKISKPSVQKERKRRMDAGKKSKSIITEITGIETDKKTERFLSNRDMMSDVDIVLELKSE